MCNSVPDARCVAAWTMANCIWRRSALLSVLSLAVLAMPVNVSAQACCAGGQALTPIRLGMEDVWAAGLQLRAGGDLGTVDSHHLWHPVANGTQNVNRSTPWLLFYTGKGIPVIIEVP